MVRKGFDNESTSLVQGKVIAFDLTPACPFCTETAIESALLGPAKHCISVLDIARRLCLPARKGKEDIVTTVFMGKLGHSIQSKQN